MEISQTKELHGICSNTGFQPYFYLMGLKLIVRRGCHDERENGSDGTEAPQIDKEEKGVITAVGTCDRLRLSQMLENLLVSSHLGNP